MTLHRLSYTRVHTSRGLHSEAQTATEAAGAVRKNLIQHVQSSVPARIASRYLRFARRLHHRPTNHLSKNDWIFLRCRPPRAFASCPEWSPRSHPSQPTLMDLAQADASVPARGPVSGRVVAWV